MRGRKQKVEKEKEKKKALIDVHVSLFFSKSCFHTNICFFIETLYYTVAEKNNFKVLLKEIDF